MTDDLIRRSDAIKAFEDVLDCDFPFISEEAPRERIEAIPTAEPKRGEWIDYTCGSGCYCSNCGWDGDDIIDECIIQDFDFCPDCGADMRKESE